MPEQSCKKEKKVCIEYNIAYFFSLVYVDGSLERVADSKDENNACQERGHRTVPPVGVALGDGVVVRMRLGIRHKLHTALSVALGDGVVVRMRLWNKKQVTHCCGRGPG